MFTCCPSSVCAWFDYCVSPVVRIMCVRWSSRVCVMFIAYVRVVQLVCVCCSVSSCVVFESRLRVVRFVGACCSMLVISRCSIVVCGSFE